LSNDPDWSGRVAAARRAPRPMAVDVTLLIPTLGRPIIANCLGAVLAGSAWPGSIIVVDQGGSVQIASRIEDLRGLGIDGRYVHCTDRGRALGLNVGLRLVSTQFVVITDDDCIPDPHWIERYAEHLAEEPGAVFTGQVAAAGEERVISTVSDPQRSSALRPRLSFDRLSGGNCGMAIEVLQKIGLFDEDPCMRFAEDGEWAYRVLKAGTPIVYEPDLIVAHVGWRSLSERMAQYRSYARSHGAFFGKHLRNGDLFIALRAGVHFARALRRWLKGTVGGDTELAANGRSYTTQLVPGIIAGMKSRVRPPSL
jgi:GT2 family glycosyltransferase